jgi:tetratricopeptide (TPR) repeat protein
LKKNHTKFKQASLLSEIIVCDDEFKVTIENYLDPYLNHFVVDTMEEAWEALNVLNESAKGRAHFFVLESLKNFQSSSTSVNGCVHALDAIEKDEYLSQAWLLKGSLRYLQNDMKGAKLAWERCLKIDPYDKVAYSYLAKVYEKLGIARLDKPAAAFRYPASTLEIESKKDQTARGQKKP